MFGDDGRGVKSHKRQKQNVVNFTIFYFILYTLNLNLNWKSTDLDAEQYISCKKKKRRKKRRYKNESSFFSSSPPSRVLTLLNTNDSCWNPGGAAREIKFTGRDNWWTGWKLGECANQHIGSGNQFEYRYKLALLCAGSSTEMLYSLRTITSCKISFHINYLKRALRVRAAKVPNRRRLETTFVPDSN